MQPDRIIELERVTRSSIEVQHYKDGSAGWTVKKYFADGEEEAALAALAALEIRLRQFYLEGGAELLAGAADDLAADPALVAKLKASLAERGTP